MGGERFAGGVEGGLPGAVALVELWGINDLIAAAASYDTRGLGRALNMPKVKIENIEIISKYKEHYERLKRTTEFGKSVSQECGGRDWPMRYSMAASLIFSACMASESVIDFLPEYPSGRIDHYSAANSCRMIIEHCMMLHYITSDDASNDEIDLRILVLHLHDACARYRFFKGSFGASKEVEDGIHLALLKGVIAEAKSRIRENSAFLHLGQDKKSTILGGQILYIGGSRRVAKEIGYSEDEYDALYN
ncbi:hypothetical protein [Xanthobacter sp. KR7-225]|uniref:hypothetical protein n=1 Tax=Xanthobacter sp. KR7-225 TaxID=3156613 RepID=UPI0032B36BAC